MQILSAGFSIDLPQKVFTPTPRPPGHDPFPQREHDVGIHKSANDTNSSNLTGNEQPAQPLSCHSNPDCRMVSDAGDRPGTHVFAVNNVLTVHVSPPKSLGGSAARNRPRMVNTMSISSTRGPGGHSGTSLHNLLDSIIAWQAPSTQRPQFSFRWTELAACKNWEVLQMYDCNLNRALRAQPFLSLSTGSEFCPVTILEPLCRCHPLWP
jgi:hypothetical protein